MARYSLILLLINDFKPSQALSILTQVQAHIEITEPNVEDLVDTSKTRRERRNFSLINCLRYVIAKRLGIKFLTGDREFKGLEKR